MADLRHSQFAGVVNTRRSERMQALQAERLGVELTRADNVDIDNSGQLSRRTGSAVRVAGAAHSLWADGDDCFFMQDINLRRLNPDLSSTILAQGLTRGLPMNYLKVNGRTYFSNGRQTGLVDGLVRSWGLPIPNPPNASAVTGGLSAGTYRFALTHLREDGQESGAGLGGMIELPDNSGIAFSWNVPDSPDVARVALYLTEPNGDTMYRVLQAALDVTNATVNSLNSAVPLQTQWMDAPPPGQCLAYHNGRIYIAVGSLLYATAALGYEYCDMRDFLNVDGSTIRFLAAVDGGLFCGTENAVHFLSGTRLEEFALRTVVSAAGIAQSALVADGLAVSGNAQLDGQQVALFATADGVCMGLRDGSVVNLTYERYRFEVPNVSPALFRRTALLNQYLLTIG